MDAPILRIAGYGAASLISILLVVALIVTSWLYARPEVGKAPSRLRWHMVTKNKIEKGTQIKEDDVTWKLGRVAASDMLIPISRTVVGKYALRDIEANSTCVPEALSALALADAPRGGAVVPIEIKTSDASSLKPGLLLAFVQQDKGVVPATTLLSKQNRPGLELLSMTASTKDAAATTLLVKISNSDLASVPLLATGVWRPVILGQPDPAAAPEQKKPPRKKSTRRSPK